MADNSIRAPDMKVRKLQTENRDGIVAGPCYYSERYKIFPCVLLTVTLQDISLCFTNSNATRYFLVF